MTLHSGDILLFRPSSIICYVASLFAWSKYSHAALVSVEDGVVYCLEVREFLGGRKIALKEYLRWEPAGIEVWRLQNPPYMTCGSHAVRAMQDFVGVKYGWFHVILAIVLRFVRAYGGKCENHPPFCSEAVSRAYRLAGCDLRPDMPDRFTRPQDLANSPFLEMAGEIA